MNSRERLLRKQVELLQAQVNYLKKALEVTMIDRDFTESVGCAFAWDLVEITEAEKVRQTRMTVASVDYLHALVGAHWDGSVKALEELLEKK